MSIDFEKRREARLAKEYARYKAAGGKDLTEAERQHLIEKGWADENGLTDAGQLMLHQLRIQKWAQDRQNNSQSKRLTTATTPHKMATQIQGETAMTDEPIALVDISNLITTCFLKRAPLKNILAWQQIYAGEGKLTKRLYLISDVETLQYLYFNTTQIAPPEILEELESRCFDLANQLAIDETSVEELLQRIPAELRKSAGQQEGGMNYMGQGSNAGDLSKGAGKTTAAADGVDKSAERAVAKAAKEADKAAKKEAKEKAKAEAAAAREAAKAAKASQPKENLSPDKAVIEQAFGAVADQTVALAKAQIAYSALVPNKDGGRSADSRTYSVEIPLVKAEGQPAEATHVSVMWFAAAASGLKTAQFYRRDAINLIRKLGLVPMQDGTPIPEKVVKETAPAETAETTAPPVAATA